MTEFDNRAAADAVAEKLNHAIATSDLEAYAALYAPGAVIWKNVHGRELTLKEHLEQRRATIGNTSSIEFMDIKRQATDSGYVQQHIYTAEHISGRKYAMPVCLVVTVKDGLIERLNEYFDPAPLLAAWAAAPTTNG